MSILVYAESSDGILKKAAFELLSYAKKIAEITNTNVYAITINVDDVSELSKYGVDTIYKINNEKLSKFSAKNYSNVIKQVAQKENAKIILFSSNTDSIYIAPLLSVALDAGFVSNVVALPETISPFKVKRNVFSNKAYNYTEINTEIKMLGLAKNSFGIIENHSTPSTINFEPIIELKDNDIEIVSIEKGKGKVTLADAEIVVSGGRGLKGPENWGLIEELAEVLQAATACSKPVSDLNWRPHSEHVGQTGKSVASNLYIAIGISGAIQHIAGINSSKTKVVINIDSEAPFFKVADYGIVGDAFEIVPKLIEKLKVFKAL